MRRRILVGLVALVALGACSGSDEGGAGVGDDPAGGGATTSAVATGDETTALPSTTTTPPLVQTPQPSGRAAIDAVLDAWRNGNRDAALLVASPEAVDALFAVPVESTQDRGCNSGNVNVNIQCVFRLPSGELQVRAAPTLDGSGYLVDFVILGS